MKKKTKNSTKSPGQGLSTKPKAKKPKAPKSKAVKGEGILMSPTGILNLEKNLRAIGLQLSQASNALGTLSAQLEAIREDPANKQ